MKKRYLSLLTAAVILMSGCGANNEAIEAPNETNGNVKEAGKNIPPEQVTESTTNGIDGSSSSVAGSIDEVNSNDSSAYGSGGETIKRLDDVVVYFDFDKFNIRDDMQNRVDKASEMITGNERLVLEGNCDEWGSDEYNYALGLKRAKSVKDALKKRGVDVVK